MISTIYLATMNVFNTLILLAALGKVVSHYPRQLIHVHVGDLPFHVTLTDHWGTTLCSGSLISDNAVLTSQYCVKGYDKIIVNLGNVVYPPEPHDLRYVPDSDIVQHPENELAILLLRDPVQINFAVQPISLYDPSENNGSCGKRSYSTYWIDGHQISLAYGDVPVQPLYGDNTLTTIPFSKQSYHQLSASQDWGAPLFTINQGNKESPRQLIGIISKSFTETTFEPIVVYLSLSESLDWLRYHIEDTRMCTTPFTK